DKGFDPKFGARPRPRAIQRYVEDPLAEEIVKGAFHPGDTVVFSALPDAEHLTLAIGTSGAHEPNPSDAEAKG
ncbi:MAG: hypothetical protein ACO3HG_04270, partial [Schleiferiaceae bacterium]